jgi:hypothetical protein
MNNKVEHFGERFSISAEGCVRMAYGMLNIGSIVLGLVACILPMETNLFIEKHCLSFQFINTPQVADNS